MRLLKIPKVLHNKVICSISINSSGDKLATAGIDGDVSIWKKQDFLKAFKILKNTETVKEDFKDEVLKIIFNIESEKTIKTEDNNISVLEWSPIQDDLLVYGSLNGKISFYDGKETKTIYPFDEKTQLETHAITSLTWSKDGRILCWCDSLNKIYLYDFNQKTYQDLSKYIVPNNDIVHIAISFDPTNNFLAIVDEDCAINIYQYFYIKDSNDYRFVLKLKNNDFVCKNNNNNFKKIAWSPDGEYVSVSLPVDEEGFPIYIISRSDGWKTKLTLSGHNFSCNNLKYNVKTFKNILDDDDEKIIYYNILASSGFDKSLSIWNTTKEKPLCVLNDISTNLITGFCWNNDGYSLFIISTDGYLTILDFDENDLGYHVTNEYLDKLNNYNKSFIEKLNIENNDDLILNNNTHDPICFDQKDATLIKDSNHLTSCKSSKKNVNFFNSPKISVKSNIPILNHDADVSIINQEDSNNQITIEHDSVINTFNITNDENSNNKGATYLDNSIINENLENKSLDTCSLDFDTPSCSVSEKIYDQFSKSKYLNNKLEKIKIDGSVVLNPNVSFAKVRLSTPKTRVSFQKKSSSDNKDFFLDVKNGSGNEIKPSKVTCFMNEKKIWCDFIPKNILLVTDGSFFWALSTTDGLIFIYAHFSGIKLLPTILLGAPITFLESNKLFLMAVTSIGELYVWNIKSKKKESVTSVSSLLNLVSKYQEDGLSKSEIISLCSITSLGIPIITLLNGNGYFFNKDLNVWHTVSESWWSFGSCYWDNSDNYSHENLNFLYDHDNISIVDFLEHKTNEELFRKTTSAKGKFINKISKSTILKEGFEVLENHISISHLENKILCCEILGENHDFHKNFITYVKQLSKLGLKLKLYEVCESLLNPTQRSFFNDSSSTNWNLEICGYNKSELLKETIKVCSKYREVQRIIPYFAEKISMFDEFK